MDFDLNLIESIIDRNKAEGNSLIAILQDIQAEYRYLTRDVLLLVCERSGIPLSQAYSVSTFYNAFSLVPRGKYKISVCLGTACHVKGAGAIVGKIERELKVKCGSTTEDMQFTLEGVRCLGCCSLAPVARIGEETHGRLAQNKIPAILKKYLKD